MKNTFIKVLKEIELEKPIFIEALPGIGHVGKLAADHIIHELNAEKFAELYSPSFPPQVLVKKDGTIEMMKNEFYYLKNIGENEDDYIILVGNTQGLSPEGQYEICSNVIDFIEKFDVKMIYTLGGLATGQTVEKPRVFGAVTNKNLQKIKKHDVIIRSEGGIVGASGLLLALGQMKGIEGACLMGETPGYYVDAEAAKALLERLMDILGISVDTSKLEERAKKIRKVLHKAKRLEEEMLERMKPKAGDEDLRYIG